MDLVGEVEVRGSFSARATMQPEEMSLEVRGVGPVRLPVSAQQAKQLIAVARPARFGLGERTLLDPRVRDTWEVPKSRVKIENRRWKAALRPVLDRLRADLGLPDGCRLQPALHSMLVYAAGQHFAVHQDSEKADGMVASLVVMLPGSGTGGSLVIEHGTERATYRGSRDRLSAVAFYADCRHEIRPVRTGFRVVLTYNLSLAGDTAGLVALPGREVIDRLATCLEEHFTTPVPAPAWRRDAGPSEPPARLVFLLDHEYSARGLGWARLKGADGARAAALRAAAEQADGEVVLALADVHETWSAYEERRGRWGRSSRSRWDDDDDDDWSDDDDDLELDELIESEISLVHWVGADGAAEAVSTSVGEEEVCASTPTVNLAPYETEYEPYMGNYGNTMDRWYRRAAVVVWPKGRAFSVRAEASPQWALDQVTEHLTAGEVETARDLVMLLAPSWDQVAGGSGQRDLVQGALAVALGVEDAGLASVLLAPFSVEQLDADDATAVAALCERYGVVWLDELVDAWSQRRRWGGSDWFLWVGTLPGLVRGLDARPEGDRAAATIIGDARQRIEEAYIHRRAVQPPSRRAESLVDLVEPLVSILESAAVVDAVEVRDAVVAGLDPRDDAIVERFLVDVVRAGGTRLDSEPLTAAGLDIIASGCAERIERRLARPVRSPDDWSIALPPGCDCELCGTLAEFLADSAERTREWPIAKPKRQHVHRRIDAAELTVTHRTLRQGSPHKLVLTKTDELFRSEDRARKRDEDDLRWLLRREAKRSRGRS